MTKSVEGDEPTTETRAATTATTNNRGVKNTSKRTNLVENQPKSGWRPENLMEPNQKSVGYKEAKTDPE
jgi:hypothetical protein